jgi:hypothetical protein
MTATTFELRADATEVLAFIEALSADLANAPHELRKLCLDFINSGTDLVRVEGLHYIRDSGDRFA